MCIQWVIQDHQDHQDQDHPLPWVWIRLLMKNRSLAQLVVSDFYELFQISRLPFDMSRLIYLVIWWYLVKFLLIVDYFVTSQNDLWIYLLFYTILARPSLVKFCLNFWLFCWWHKMIFNYIFALYVHSGTLYNSGTSQFCQGSNARLFVSDLYELFQIPRLPFDMSRCIYLVT